MPRTNANGHAHISMRGYREDAYPGNGIYVVDAITLLEHKADDLSSHVVRLRPRYYSVVCAANGQPPRHHTHASAAVHRSAGATSSTNINIAW